MSDINSRYNAADRLKDEGKTDEAIREMRAIVADDPTHVLSHLALAKLLTAAGEHEAAVEHAKKACELEPEEWFNYTALSMTYQKAWAGTGKQEYITMAEDAMARSRMLEQR